jgi:hypothetical protein
MFYRIFWDLLVELGALTCWTFKGFRGTYDDRNSEKNYNINLGVGMVAFLVLVGVIASVATFC